MKKRLEITYPDGRVRIIEGEDLVVYTYDNYHEIRKHDARVAILSFECSVVDLAYVAEVKERVEEKTQPAPIKETGELGMILDTERPWRGGLPSEDISVEVKLQDGKTEVGSYSALINAWYIRRSPNWIVASDSNPVVAWRELE